MRVLAGAQVVFKLTGNYRKHRRPRRHDANGVICEAVHRMVARR